MWWEYLPHIIGYFGSNFTGVDIMAIEGHFGKSLNYHENYVDFD